VQDLFRARRHDFEYTVTAEGSNKPPASTWARRGSHGCGAVDRAIRLG
jgi:hypothetical protein